jgi:hypothetical protein
MPDGKHSSLNSMLPGKRTIDRPAILLINPWIHDFAAFDLWARPLGLLILASLLRRNGWEPCFVDCLDPDHPRMPPVKVNVHSQGHYHRTPIEKPEPLNGVPRTFCRYGVDPPGIKKDLEAIRRPTAILVTSFMTYWYTGVRETIQLIRDVFPGIPVLLGGIYASLMARHAVEQCRPDRVVEGPGEAGLFPALYQLTGIDCGPGGERRELQFDAALDLMSRVRFLPLLTSRGCPLRCAYCASSRIVPSFVRRSPQDVVSEIESAVLHHGIRDIALYDDAFLVDSGVHALPILESTAERVPGVRWHTPNGLHAAAITPQVATALKRAGFETLRIGLESTSDQFHATTGGKTDLTTFVSAVRNLKEAGFATGQIGVYLLVGLPNQTREEIERDVDTVLKAGAMPKLAEYSPVPGTRMWPQAVETARFPVGDEPLFHNCTLLPAASDGVDAEFLRITRSRIRDSIR